MSENITAKDLQDYFTQFGQVIDVYIPKPFRAFGFVTFVEAEIAQSLCGESHIIKGVSVHVSKADPKEDDRHNRGNEMPIQSQPTSMRRFPSSSNGMGSNSGGSHHGSGGGGGGSTHHMSSSMSANQISSGSGSSSQSNSKSSSSRSKMKYDSGHGGSHSIDLYDTRQHDMRSSSSSHHHHHHHSGGSQGGGGGSNANNGATTGSGSHHGHHQQHDQMSAMMNMFNPMMAAFIQQLANGMQPTPAQSALDSHNGAPPTALSHHHAPPPPWGTPNDYAPRSNSMNGPTALGTAIPSSYGAAGGYGTSTHNPRYKQEKF